MAALYIHIPFCKKACHYCSFYFVLSQTKKQDFIKALCLEIADRKIELDHQVINSIYLGGGTPSILSISDLETVFETIYKNYLIDENAEIGMESNPENLLYNYLKDIKTLPINRLSIGVQSFFDDDLKLMNRNHLSIDSRNAIENATKLFDNVSIDLMFGLPYSGMERWKENLNIATSFDIKHISTYNLTVEEKTALAKKVAKQELPIESDDTLNSMYLYTINYLESKGLNQYEISNFGRDRYYSKHNMNYWNGTHYLAFGPSAHSYLRARRRSNISNINTYIKNINSKKSYCDIEILNNDNLYNEFVLTRLRTIFGIDVSEIKVTFGEKYANLFLRESKPFLYHKQMVEKKGVFKLTNEGKILADYISSSLMI